MKHHALANSVRLALLSTPVIITGLMTSAQAANSCSSANSITYVCSGSETNGINITGSSLNISVAPGFEVDTKNKSAIELTNSAGNLIFKDEHQSKISGEDFGITAANGGSAANMMINTSGHVNGGISAISSQNNGTGETVITTAGKLSSGSIGINAINGTNSTNLTITTETDFGVGQDAINATNNGTGETSITTSVNIGSGKHGIYANNAASATDMTINGGGNISVGGDAINITNNGTGNTAITTSGTVSGGYGIYAVNGHNAKDMTINVSGSLLGWTDGIHAENHGSGHTFITNTGQILGPSYGHAIITAGRASTITNSGSIIGNVKFGNEGNTFINANGGTWDISGGTSEFGTGTNAFVNAGTLIAANGSAIDNVQTATLNNISMFNHSGNLTMANERAGDITVINGNYIGNGGALVFDTVLGDDNSVTDRLIINGDTSGTSTVQVNNIGGGGAQTLNGIEIISVSGQSNGLFVLGSRIVAGAYDYLLVRGEGGNFSNWYLNNSQNQGSTVQVLRPESGIYTANLAAANHLFTTNFQDLIGETQYTDPLTGEKKATSMWMRNEGGHNRSRDGSGQLKTQDNRYVLQIGGDITQWSSNGNDRYHLGVMAGYANSKSNTVSNVYGYRANGSVNGYSTGIYGTWYANAVDKTGMHVGTWAQYSWFKNQVTGQGMVSESYHSQGVTASMESGYTFRLGQTENGLQSYFIQPKAMVTWMGVKADKHTELNGTEVSGEGDGNIQTRLGAKTYISDNRKVDGDKDSDFQQFIEVNWIHNTRDFASRMDGIAVKQNGTTNMTELKLGVEGQLNQQVGLWGNVAREFGHKGYSDTSVTLGGKYSF